MDNEYTVTLPVKGKDPNNYQKEVTKEMTFHVAFSDFTLVRPFTQADTTEFSEENVDYSTATYCLVRWKGYDGKVRHVTGCTVKNPHDSEDYLQARRHAFAVALRKLFPGYYILNPNRENKSAVPHAIDGRNQHTANRATFWAWFRGTVEPEIIQEMVEDTTFGKSPVEQVVSDLMVGTWLEDFNRAFLRGRFA